MSNNFQNNQNNQNAQKRSYTPGKMKMNIIGFISKDAQMNTARNGADYCYFSVGVNQLGTDEISWFNVSYYGEKAEKFCEKLTKGKLINVEGAFRVSEWQDRDGRDRYTLNITATDILLLSSPSPKKSDEQHQDNADGFIGDDEELEQPAPAPVKATAVNSRPNNQPQPANAQSAKQAIDNRSNNNFNRQAPPRK